MARFTTTLVVELTEALLESYEKASKLEQFLFTRLGRRFEDLTAPNATRPEAFTQVVRAAHEHGWLADLVREASDDRPGNEQLQRLLAALPDLDRAPDATLGRSYIDRPSLLCGRAVQWNQVCQVAPTRLHHVVLVQGARGEDPMHFRDRVQVWLPPDPSRAIVAVHWPTPPKSLAEMADALLSALAPTSGAGLTRALGERLAYQNLVLLHPCISDAFAEPQFVEYYTRLLPEALAAHGAGALKCVQPIEWPIRTPTGLVGRLFGGWRSEVRDSALGLIATLKARQVPALRVVDLDELHQLETPELERFLEGSEFPPDHQRILLAQLVGGPQVSGYIFKTIDDYWRSIGGAT